MKLMVATEGNWGGLHFQSTVHAVFTDDTIFSMRC